MQSHPIDDDSLKRASCRFDDDDDYCVEILEYCVSIVISFHRPANLLVDVAIDDGFAECIASDGVSFALNACVDSNVDVDAVQQYTVAILSVAKPQLHTWHRLDRVPIK